MMEGLTYIPFMIAYLPIILICAGVTSYILNDILSRKVLLIAKKKRLFTPVTDRSSHNSNTPQLGGISIFIVIFFASLIVIGTGFNSALGFTLSSIFLLFLTGIKDDLIGTSPRTKLFIQIFSGLLFVINPDFALGYFNDFLLIEFINPNWTYLIGIVFLVSLTNAYNFIDGIDGLAGFISVICFFTFGIYFYQINEYGYTIFCAVLIGSLINFLKFNLSKTNSKLFLGDSGSLVIGFLLATFSLRMVELQPIKPSLTFFPSNSILFILTLLVIPINDAIRVILIRLLQRGKIWSADNNHTHHVFLLSGFTHFKATAILSFIQIFSVLGFFLLNNLGQVQLHFYVLIVYLNLNLFLFFLEKRQRFTKKEK